MATVPNGTVDLVLRKTSVDEMRHFCERSADYTLEPTTILQNGPASGAGDKRARTDPVDHSDVFGVDLDPFHQRPDDFAPGREISVIQAR